MVEPPASLSSSPHEPRADFAGSAAFWEQRYQSGGHSGLGSRGQLAEFKARILNDFVREYRIDSVVEFGCGDGFQLQLASYPHYIGLDVAQTAIRQCIDLHGNDPTKSFFLYAPDAYLDNAAAFTSDLALSLDVIFHLVEDEVFERYMEHLFAAAWRFVAIYSSNCDDPLTSPHVRHRIFTDWIAANAPEWTLYRTVPNDFPSMDHTQGSFSDFYFYQRADTRL